MTVFHDRASLPSHRIPLRRIGAGRIAGAFKGRFDAWSFAPTAEESWFHQFRERVLASIGQMYLPVFRMADGEFRFLLGRRVRWESDRPLRDCLAVAAERIGVIQRKTRTSWGENYDWRFRTTLRESLTEHLRIIARHGYLGVLLSDNGLGTAHEYRRPFCEFMARNRIPLDSSNYVPFHFVCELLSAPGWEEFLQNRRILIVTGLDDKNPTAIEKTLTSLGVRHVQFLEISREHSMQDTIDASAIRMPVDLCLVAAGVGAANVMVQLQGLGTVVLDIGGYLHCLENSAFVAHGVFRAPVATRA